jgi:hypothetical protein
MAFILYYLSSVMEKGARTNNLDFEIKKLMIKLNKESTRMQIYANQSQVYKLKGSDEENGVP